ncbi:MAG: EAL domain-containing protein, partial [Acholeplasmatales bacterium]
ALRNTLTDLKRQKKGVHLIIWHLNQTGLYNLGDPSRKRNGLDALIDHLHRQFGRHQVFRFRHDTLVAVLTPPHEATNASQDTSPPVSPSDTKDFDTRLVNKVTEIPDLQVMAPLSLSEVIALAEDFMEAPTQDTWACVDQLQAERLLMLHHILKRLPEIFEDGTLTLHYQPVINKQTGRFDMAEALLRFEDATVGRLDVGLVLRLIAREQLQHRLTQFVIEQACKDLSQEKNRLHSIKRVALNFAYREIEDPRFEALIVNTVRQYGLAPSQFGIELTEQEMGRSMEAVEHCIERLRPAGFYFHLDDFGVGYSNLAFLIRTRFDVVKFDRSLLRSITDSDEHLAFLAKTVALFKNKRLDLVIEGVETKQELDAIAAIPFDYIQGYVYAKPMPLDALMDFIASQTTTKREN